MEWLFDPRQPGAPFMRSMSGDFAFSLNLLPRSHSSLWHSAPSHVLRFFGEHRTGPFTKKRRGSVQTGPLATLQSFCSDLKRNYGRAAAAACSRRAIAWLTSVTPKMTRPAFVPGSAPQYI